jgi:hypothetical protein
VSGRSLVLFLSALNSYRSATNGLTLAAFRAGMYAASAATKVSSTHADASVSASVELMPLSFLVLCLYGVLQRDVNLPNTSPERQQGATSDF